MISSNIEDYLETIYLFIKKNDRPIRTTELAQLLNINPSAITSMAKKLHSKEYILYEPYIGIRLTEKGKEVAKKIIRKHKIIESFLRDYLKLDEKKASEEACKIEHVISDETITKLYNYMNESKKSKI
ncbi:iron dependent repressor [Methanococcus aeolicus Nankai-3]|uniref:Iron dependent repressor n=1 Tax=Methanococcus aeolicus (strain ATCC BAA-1280 / DSM 17508 / OCM 812 / Nankai-3) TaxID=419665 RepID=A6UX26_META3|nr:metal-dependent transcriptional regulator [Methanococcus aeolicus]ABR57048.1 iron dependent repressor [Methanococcus aeolicus Nankai-3]